MLAIAAYVDHPNVSFLCAWIYVNIFLFQISLNHNDIIMKKSLEMRLFLRMH